MGWRWMFMSLETLVYLVLIAVVIWLLVRATDTGGRPAATSWDSAREILAQRYARGEIDDSEYQQPLRTLSR